MQNTISVYIYIDVQNRLEKKYDNKTNTALLFYSYNKTTVFI